MPLLETEVTIKNRAGLHTRPAAGLVKMCSKFKSEIFLSRDGFEINAKSIIGVMTLAAEQGCSLQLRADGDDAEDAINSLREYFESGFGEPI
ncbi:MAG: HPr family phosphocarrier protein [Candidatus Kapabacteria bacterium]|nr:HPr family phosphocarrier protein [Ignavibacteriota bacterium]MCW5886425.1 HPr family phosphocarrier protein [Candidatus Kapabacteria bacterium]